MIVNFGTGPSGRHVDSRFGLETPYISCTYARHRKEDDEWVVDAERHVP